MSGPRHEKASDAFRRKQAAGELRRLRRADPLAPNAAAPGGTRLTTVVREQAEARKAPLNWSVIRRLWRFTTPHRRMRNGLIVLVVVRGFQLPLLAWLIAAVINGPISDRDINGAAWGAGLFLALAVFIAVTLHYRMKWSMQLGEWVVEGMRDAIFRHLQRLPMAYYDRTPVGRILARMTSDVEAVKRGIQDVLFVTLVNMGHIVLGAAIMAWYDLPLFLVVLAMSPVILWINRYFGRRLGAAWRQVQESMSRVTATIAESVSGIRVTQGFTRQQVNAQLFRDLVLDHSTYNVNAARLAGNYIPLLELNSQFFLAGLLLLGGWQVLGRGFFPPGDPAVTYDALVIFVFQLPQFFMSIRLIAQQHNTALTAMAGGERVLEVLDTPLDDLEDDDATASAGGADTGTASATRGARVAFRDVRFGYVPGQPVLRGITLTAEPGTTTALVGRTGSGKSTLIKLISKFYLPDSGALLVDGTPVRKLRTASLLARIGIVLQSNFLFTGTVTDNIRIGRPDATDAEVRDAAQRLDCLDLLEALPQGLDTPVGERGTALSLGQRQLVCFCRAMLADPDILILDEATSSVDTLTEARIQHALETLLTGRTSFVVAHRLSTIRHAHQVLVLEQGEIIERGTHHELLSLGGQYATLYRQFIQASE